MDSPWHVAHTRPRAEKKVAEFFRREGWATELPLYLSVKRYRGKRLTFHKTLFPGYVFVRLNPEQIPAARQHQHIASLLVPPDPEEFSAQLSAILSGLSGQLEVRIAPEVTEGRRVRLIGGPLRGVEGVVIERSKSLEVLLRLDFIGQAAAFRVIADEVELI